MNTEFTSAILYLLIDHPVIIDSLIEFIFSFPIAQPVIIDSLIRFIMFFCQTFPSKGVFICKQVVINSKIDI